MFSTIPTPFSAVVIGASGGLGAAFVQALAADLAVSSVLACARSALPAGHEKLTRCALDITDEASIAAAARQTSGFEPVRLVIVATGLLHEGAGFQPEKTLKRLDANALARAFAVNTIGPALVAKHFLPLMPRTGKTVFGALSARVGSISDNRTGGWYGYRAAKAALNMMLANLAIETAAKSPEAIVCGLHPGTVDTKLSAPFQAGVRSGGLFAPEQSAGHLLAVMDGLSPSDSGGVFAWDGKRIEP